MGARIGITISVQYRRRLPSPPLLAVIKGRHNTVKLQQNNRETKGIISTKVVQTEQQNAGHHRIFLDSNKCIFLQQIGAERPNKLFIGLSVLLLLKQKSWGFPYRLVVSVWWGEVSLLCKAGGLSQESAVWWTECRKGQLFRPDASAFPCWG